MVDLTGAGAAGALADKMMASDPNSKLDDRVLAVALAKYAGQYPDEVLLGLYSVVKQLAQNGADIASLGPADAKARIAKILESTDMLAKSRTEVEKTKDMKKLDTYAQNIQQFLQTEYGVQSQRASSEIGLDSTARGGVARGTSTLGFFGKLVCGFCDVIGMEPPAWAEKWVREAESYTATPIKSGKVTQSETDTHEITQLDADRYAELVLPMAEMYQGKAQEVVTKVATTGAKVSQDTGEAGVAASAIKQADASKPAGGGTAGAPRADAPKLNLAEISKEMDHVTKPWYGRAMDTVKRWFSFGDNSNDITQPVASNSPAPQVAAPKLELN